MSSCFGRIDQVDTNARSVTSLAAEFLSLVGCMKLDVWDA